MAVHCLLSTELASGVFKLEANQAYSIGRASINHVVLGHDAVSRHHAEVVWEGGACALRDLGSTQGTLVNDERISGRRVLSDGDAIQIGPCTLRYRTADTLATLLGEVQGDSALALTVSEGTPTARTFQGTELIKLAHLICLSRADGRLTIEGATTQGHLQFVGGEIVQAGGPGGLPGQTAAWSLLGQQEGSYHWEPYDRELLPGGTAPFLMDMMEALGGGPDGGQGPQWMGETQMD